MKKIAYLALALLVFISSSTESIAAEYKGKKQTFVVSAYYSPLPGQENYLRRTYDAEIRLNGSGVNGADGSGVFMGMIAAPRNYSFGTKIYIPGLGIGSVHDRGGAIINKKGYDRIDIWMGYGDNGLKRAMQWGMRTIDGVILDNDSAEINLSYSNVGLATLGSRYKAINQPVEKDQQNSEIKKVQLMLKEINYLDAEATGYFGDETEQAIINFQVDHGIIASEKSQVAGIFGPKTRSTLENYTKKNINKKPLPKTPKNSFIKEGLEIGTKDKNVKRLQIVLSELGYYQGDLGGKYDKTTEQAVLDFQLQNKVINSKDSNGAGRYGPKTSSTLNHVLNQKKQKIKNFEKEAKIISFENKKSKKPKQATEVNKPKKPEVKIMTFNAS
ncbi:MAG: peptidoglycan-binding protein [Candidatus Gracilibacteria bacterium]|nr:peptidoglycan-binding protein [Candidatus Gracilibacteria bacterium]